MEKIGACPCRVCLLMTCPGRHAHLLSMPTMLACLVLYYYFLPPLSLGVPFPLDFSPAMLMLR